MKYYLTKETEISAVQNSGFSQSGITNKDAARSEFIQVDFNNLIINIDGKIYLYDNDKVYIGEKDVTKGQLISIDNATYIGIEVINGTEKIKAEYYYICYPHYKSLKITDQLDDETLIFRKSVSDKVRFMNNDFTRLRDMGIDDVLYFKVIKKEEILNAKISKSNITFDYNYNIAEVSLTMIDDYTDFETDAEEKFNMTELGAKKNELGFSIAPVLQTYIKGATVMQSYQDGISTEFTPEFPTEIDADLSGYGFRDVLTYIEMKTSNQPAGLNLGKYFKGTQAKMTDGFGHALEAYDYYKDRCFYRIGEYKTRTRFPINLQGVTLGLYEDGNVGTLADISLEFYTIKTVAQRLLTIDKKDDSRGELITAWGNYRYYAKNFVSKVVYSGATSSKDEDLGQDEYGNYFTKYPGGYAITPSEWSFATMWFLVDSEVQASINANIGNINISDFYKVGEVIKKLCEKIGLQHDLTPEYSRFLYGENEIEKFDLYVTPKSNVIKAYHSQAAVKSETSLTEILEMLRNVLKAYYFIEDGKLKIEHITYFLNGRNYELNYDVQLNLKQKKDIFNRKQFNFLQNKVSYNKADISRKYTMEWMDDTTELFGGQNVIIDSNFVEKDSQETINISNFTSDVSYIMSQPDNISMDGFVIAATDRNNTTVKIKTVVVDNEAKQLSNGMLAWRYIFGTFYSYDLPSRKYRWEKGGDGTAKGIKRTMQQEIQFIGDIDIDPYRQVLTDIGAGTIQEIEKNINTNMIKLTLTFEPK